MNWEPAGNDPVRASFVIEVSNRFANRSGNGRIGRLLLTLLFVHWDLLPLPLLYLSAFFEKHRQDYYDLLLNVSAGGAWREWVRFFLQGVADQARDAVVRAKRLQDLQAA